MNQFHSSHTRSQGLFIFPRPHRSAPSSNSAARRTSGSILSELTGIISSHSTSPSHHVCNNRLNAVPLHQGNNNNSITQLSSPLSAVTTSIQALVQNTPTTNENGQQCQGKSQLLINHKNHAEDNFSPNLSGEIDLQQMKGANEATTKQQNHISAGDDMNGSQFENSYQNSNENAMITIVTINSMSNERGNSIA